MLYVDPNSATRKKVLPKETPPVKRSKWVMSAIILSVSAILFLLISLNYKYIYDHYLIFCY